MSAVRAVIWTAAALTALGIGSAVAVGVAAPASADSRGATVDSAVVRPHPGPRAPRGNRAVNVGRAPVTASRPANRASQVSPSDVWSSLSTRVAGILGCDPRGKLQTIYQGTHFVIPGTPSIWITSDSGDATFTADSAYDLKDEDQHDWNKLAGLTFTPLEPNRNAAMVVWRLNNVTDPFFEVGPFFNDEYAYVFPTEAQIIRVPTGATFSYDVDYTGITVSYGDITVRKPYPSDLIPNFWTSARVLGWFGGSEVAPKTVSYYKHVY